MPQLSIIGLNHQTAPVEVRERFSLSENDVRSCIAELAPDLLDLVILSTCNRSELIFDYNDTESLEKVQNFIRQKSELSQEDVDQYFYFHEKTEALDHLFHVASGLNSLVIGEAQILGQLKQAFDLSASLQGLSSNFLNILQKTLQCAKAVRRETAIGEGSLSVSYVAVQLAANIFESLNDKTVLLVGAGEMCELAGVHFREAGVSQILVANRTLSRAEDLATKLKGQAYALDKLDQAMLKADIILSCTGSDDYVIRRENVTQTMNKRKKTTPIFLIDIAVPRDIEESINKLSDVYLYNIDDLNQIIEKNQSSRDQHVVQARQIVERQLKDFHDNIKTSELGPVISSLKKRMNEIKADELNKLFQKAQHFTEDDQKIIQRSMDLMINKILHEPITSLREEIKKDEEPGLLDKFKNLFNLN